MDNHSRTSTGIPSSPVKGCAGEVEPDVAWEVLSTDENAVLVDVRTLPEWSFVGVPNLRSLSKQPVLVPWRMYPTMEINPSFVAGVLAEAMIDRESCVFFLCRSGGRSLDAAIEMTRHGFTQCYNILGGFEGEVDQNGHRGTINGWKQQNLPWEQR